jgi:hypothetical protein
MGTKQILSAMGLDALFKAHSQRVKREFLLGLFLTYVLATTLLGAWKHSLDLQGFAYGDWVINYYNGFVRRGLTGQLILDIGGVGHAPLVVFMVKAVLYLIFFSCAYKLFRPLLDDTLLFICIIAPMGLAYTSIDSLAAGRKELLLLALLAALTISLADHARARASHLMFWACTALGLAFILLSHEGLLFFCGFPLLVLFLHTAANGRVLLALMGFAACFICLAALFLLLIAFKGTPEIVAEMCQALSKSAPDRCETTSAISWLGADVRTYVGPVLSMGAQGALWVYGLAALLSYLPIIGLVACSETGKNWAPPKAIVVFGLWAANLPTALIYGITEDWGRWLYISVTSNTFLLAYCYRAQILNGGAPFQVAAKMLERLGHLGTMIKIAFQFAVIVFLLFWNAPPYRGLVMGKGHIGHLERVLEHVQGRI